MIAFATGTATVLRGSVTDDYGDTVDGVEEAATGLPWSVMEQRRIVTTTDDPDPRFVIFYTGRMPWNADVRTGDRVRDEVSGQVYVVDSWSRPNNPFYPGDLRLDLRRVS